MKKSIKDNNKINSVGINKINPLVVFISSRQDDCTNVKWSELRRSIKNKLEENGDFNVFLFEDSSSCVPSEIQIHNKVNDANVYVLLLERDIGDGTKKEMHEAMSNKDIMKFVYFIKCDDVNNDDSKNDVKEFRKNIHNFDVCSTSDVDNDIDGICDRIFNDLNQQMIDSLKYYAKDRTVTNNNKVYLDDKYTNNSETDYNYFRSEYKNEKNTYKNDVFTISISDKFNQKFQELQKNIFSNEYKCINNSISTIDKLFTFANEFLLYGRISSNFNCDLIKDVFDNDILYRRFVSFISYVKVSKIESLKMNEEILNEVKGSQTDKWIIG